MVTHEDSVPLTLLIILIFSAINSLGGRAGTGSSVFTILWCIVSGFFLLKKWKDEAGPMRAPLGMNRFLAWLSFVSVLIAWLWAYALLIWLCARIIVS